MASTREKKCDQQACNNPARWRVFLHVPTVKPSPDPKMIEMQPEVREVVVPIPLYVCNAHKISKAQGQRLLTAKLRARLTRTLQNLQLLFERVYVTHDLLGSA